MALGLPLHSKSSLINATIESSINYYTELLLVRSKKCAIRLYDEKAVLGAAGRLWPVKSLTFHRVVWQVRLILVWCGSRVSPWSTMAGKFSSVWCGMYGLH